MAEQKVSLRTQRLVALLLLISQAGITITGAVVRVTGSGLGCVTWPECHPGSLVPQAGAAPAIHQAIEFGNRLLTFVVIATSAAAIIAMHRAHRRKELKMYAWVSMGLVILQALIGAASVLLDLRWWSVALHFLPSMILVWVAAMLYVRVLDPDDGTPTHIIPQSARMTGLIAAIALAVVLMTGTMVTGSGPHSGDEGVGMEGRLEVNTEYMAVGHAMCMYVYLALTIITLWLLYTNKAPRVTLRAGWVLIGVIIVQWAIGVFQFYQGVPRWTVPFHVGMSAVVTAYTAFLYAHGRKRLKEDAPERLPAEHGVH
ncbi:heme A synthase [Corynebacterium incognita]|uniref:Heme A synthase n=1 Tax=Corynebacterium incognita TaxID=2754725 RepID=A0A7G7CPT3_9CORY|nr:heme A synthase [Corynebacterium incognita]QNE89599.1 heme A synthase [Corynebacterium incognita]